MLRTLAPLILISAFPASATAAPIPRDPPKDGPHLVIQFKPLDEWFADYEHIYPKIKDYFGDPFPDVKEVRAILDRQYPDWKKVVDQTRPWGSYTTFQPDLTETKPVILIPVLDSKAFVAAMNRFFGESEEIDAIHSFEFPQIFGGFKKSFFRFKHDYAFITIGDKSALKNPEKLPDPRDILGKDDRALISARLFVEGVPVELKKQANNVLDKVEKAEKNAVGAQEILLMSLFGANDSARFAKRCKQIVREAKWLTVRLEFDRKSDEMSLELDLVPQKDSALGKEIAAYKSPKTQFGGLLENESVAGLVCQVGTYNFLKGENNVLNESLQHLLRWIHSDGDAEKLTELTKVVRQVLPDEDVDLFAGLKYAKDASTICLTGALKLKKARQLEAALQIYFKTLPEAKGKKFTADAVKLSDGKKAHKMVLDLSEDALDSFGSSDLYFTFSEDAVYAAIGADAVKHLKEMVETKPKEGPALRFEVSPERLAPLLDVLKGKAVTASWSKLFPKDRKVKLLGLESKGGEALRNRFSADFVDILVMWLSTKKDAD